MSVKIVYRPTAKESKEGYLKIRITENRKSKFRSLGIKVLEKNWLDGKQRVSSNETNHKKINEKIAEAIDQLNKYDNQFQSVQSSSQTILQFIDNLINSTVVLSSQKNHKSLKNLFHKFLITENLNDLKFKNLTNDLVVKFYNYMRVSGYATNTANDYINRLKYIINKAVDQKIVTYNHNPFANIKLKNEATNPKSFSEKDIQKLIHSHFAADTNFKYNKVEYSLNDIKNIYIFQFAMQGMRISDVQFLRWNNFRSDNGVLSLNYKMIKTKKNMSVTVTPLAIRQLTKILLRLCPDLANDIKETEKDKFLLGLRIAEIVSAIGSEKDETQIKNYKEGLDILKNELREIEKKVDLVKSKAILELSRKETRNNFVFFFLSNERFKNFHDKEIGILSTEQFKELSYARNAYNKQLQNIEKICEFKTPLRSHTARHTYTQIMLDNDAQIVDISYSLGHKNLATTENYITSLRGSEVHKLNNLISDKFI